MSAFNAIDLSVLPAPDVVEIPDYEAILDDMRLAVIEAAPEIAAAMELESEPAVKVLEICAYRAFLTLNRVNQAARACMLAFSAGSDLEHLGALLGVERLVVTPADPEADPPVAEVLEDDERLRERIQLALEGYSSAGPVGAYVFHALSASAEVKDVAVESPVPGDVLVTVLSTDGDGTAAPELLATVLEALNDEYVRPLCDSVTVQGATIQSYDVVAELEIPEGPDASVVVAAAEAALAEYVAASHALGRIVSLSGLMAALHQPGVTRATVTSPAADIEPAATAAAWCNSITVTEAP